MTAVRSRLADGGNRFVGRLHERVSIQSLALLRMAFGLIMVWDVWRFFYYDRIERYYVQPDFWFTYYGFSWISPLPDPYIYYAWFLVGVVAFMVAIGFFYRFSIITFTLLFSYFFLLDQAQYLNHFYMVILFAGLLCVLPAHRAYSVDAALWPALRSDTVPYWSVWALRAQVEIILILAGLVKITEDWLKLEPLGMWLRDRSATWVFGDLAYYDWVVAVGAYGTVALHVLGAPLLLFRRTRLPIFIVYCLFHISNADLFGIGIFPWLTIAVTTIFFAPDWPRQLFRRLHGWFEDLPPRPSRPAPPATAQTLWTRSIVCVLVGWMALQVLIPMRFALYPSEVRWSQEGHRFSWRMKMFDREGRGYFSVVDRDSGQRWLVDPEDHLTRRQARKMLTTPDMVLQFAHFLEDTWAERGHGDVAVHAHVEMALNGREFQPLVHAHIDLTTRRRELWPPADWITPLVTPFTPWEERQHADYDGPRN